MLKRTSLEMEPLVVAVTLLQAAAAKFPAILVHVTPAHVVADFAECWAIAEVAAHLRQHAVLQLQFAAIQLQFAVHQLQLAVILATLAASHVVVYSAVYMLDEQLGLHAAHQLQAAAMRLQAVAAMLQQHHPAVATSF